MCFLVEYFSDSVRVIITNLLLSGHYITFLTTSLHQSTLQLKTALGWGGGGAEFIGSFPCAPSPPPPPPPPPVGSVLAGDQKIRACQETLASQVVENSQQSSRLYGREADTGKTTAELPHFKVCSYDVN